MKNDVGFSNFDKLDSYFEDCVDVKKQQKNRTESFKKPSLKFFSQECNDEYSLLKSASIQIEDDEKKNRTSSILKMLEYNANEKVKLCPFDS